MPNTYWDTAKIIDRLNTEAADAVISLTPGVEDSTTAQSKTIDNFDDCTLDNWTKVEDNPNANSSAAFAGDCGMDLPIPQSSVESPDVASYPGDGLPVYPEPDDTVEVYFQLYGDSGGGVRQGGSVRTLHSENNGDSVVLSYDKYSSNDELRFRYYDGSSNSEIDSSNPGFSFDTWYLLRFDLTQGSMTFEMETIGGSNVTTLSIPATVPTHGDYGIYGNYFNGGDGFGDSGMYLDEMVLV